MYNPVSLTCSQRRYILIANLLVLCTSDTKASTIGIFVRPSEDGFSASSVKYTNHSDLEFLWRRYEQSAPDYSASPLTLHGTMNYHSLAGECYWRLTCILNLKINPKPYNLGSSLVNIFHGRYL